MKRAKILLRIIGWTIFVSGLALLLICMLLNYKSGYLIEIQSWFHLDIAFWSSWAMIAVGVIATLCIEDDACWESICEWGKRKKIGNKKY